MGDKGRSERNLTGGFTHYDSKGHKIGRSEPSLFGGYTDYDAKGHKIGHSDPAFFGGYNHYDAKGHKTGHSDPDLFGGYNHYDSSGKRPVQVIRLFSGDIRITLLQAAVILQPVFTDHMIALRYGLYAASGIILWQILLQAACLLSSIMQLARLW